MELAAAELAFSTLSPIFKKLCKYAYDSNFGGDVTTEEMKHLNEVVRFKIMALIREAGLDPSDQLRPLLENLQAAAFEAEDLLDLYEYKQIKYQVSSSPNLIKKSIRTVKEKLGFMLPKSSLRISLEKLLKFADEIEKLYPLIKFKPDMTQQNSKIPQANTSTSNPSSPYFGRAKQCNIIIELALDESHTDSIKGIKRVPIIAIRGLGGSGKTVTTQHVYNDGRIKNCFDLRMWIHVSRSFDVHRLTKEIIESAKVGKCSQINNLDVLQTILKESVSKRKKFLLVLDDIWCKDRMQWDQLLSPLNEVGWKGSKIIITTRMEQVASILQVEKVIPLEELKDEDCWSILKHYAFNNHEEIIEDQKLVNVGNQIISKVKYSPLALRIVGSSLRQRSVNEWEKILKGDMLKETRDVLLFSFQHLPSHLQRCFAYCSLFPKGYNFSFGGYDKWEFLIPLWISQGFIENTSEQLTLEKQARIYIEELLSYSFFEKYSYNSFIIHDLLHDLAEEVSKEQCHRIEHSDSLNIPTTCIHLSIRRGERSENTYISDILKLRYLRTLLIFDITDFNDNIDIFQNLTKLRALYVYHDWRREGLSNLYIGKLKHLRYLRVRYDKKLPSSLPKLYHLQFFHLITNTLDGYLKANTLPQGFGNLINLRTLKFYDRCNNELDYLYYNSKEIGLEKLTSLQNLREFHPKKDSVNGMILLKNFPLCGSLKVLNLENVKSKVEAAEAMLNQKRNLNDLEFGWSNTSSSTENSNTCKEVLEGLEPHSNLETLRVIGYQGVKVASWMVKDNWLPGLRTLKLSSCKSLKEVLFLPPCLEKLVVENCDELMQLPPVVNTLRILWLENCPKLMLPSMSNKSLRLDDLWIERCSGIENQLFIELPFLTNLKGLKLDGFPNLQTLPNLSPTMTGLMIENCPKLTSLGNNDCPNLTDLEIKDCPKLTSLGNNDFPNLTRLEIKDCPKLTSLGNNDFSNLTRLEIEDCPKLTSLGNNDFPKLTDLKIKDCPKLTSLGNNDFPNLTCLEIKDCRKLTSLGNNDFPNLTELKINYCPKLTSLENLQYCTFLEIINCPMLMRDEALLVEGDIIKPLSQIEHIAIDEPLLVLVLVQQQAFSSIKILFLKGLQRPFPPLLEDHFHQLSSLETLILDGFTTLPNLEKLSSLVSLSIRFCFDVEFLPNLPISLQELILYICPELKVNYKEGGRLRHTISHRIEITSHP